ncbi:putative lipid phosphate phosphatase 3, chloroplastic isoform X2 [Elaeis guineensis]|uniref:putative lipid phosphate phosphatase 3, chloroplastic isoform X2 n=1 Tax=Elaeis guineensis var. tenera TaxID=51953 RepID=UPI000579FD8D
MLSCWLLNSRRRDNMGEIQLGSHTVQSHGVKVAKIHKHDWFIVIFLMMLVVALNIIHPFYRFVGKDTMTDLKYPLKSNTVPVWAVPIISVLLPIAVFVAVYFRRRDVYDLHHAMLGLLFSVLITGVITDALKDAVGRPRPDFYWRCFPDGKELYDRVTGNVICHGERSLLKDGHKSFPSGHTSCIVVATFCYLQFYPAPYHTDGWGPYAYFQMMESSRANPTNAANQQPEGSSNNELPGAHHDRTEPNDLESGRT